MPDSPKNSNQDETTFSSQGVRTAVSFLLFLHLFALFVAVNANRRPVSGLRSQLSAVPFIEPYLQALNMDLAYNYHMTYANGNDFDPQIEIEIEGTGERNPDATMLVFPRSDTRPNVRYQRYRNLLILEGGIIAAGNQEMESLIPHAIAKQLLAEAGISSGKHRLRLRRHLPLQMEEVGSSEPSIRDPMHERLYETVYEADVFFSHNDLTGENELNLNKAASALETAPVENKTSANNKAPAKKKEP